jgi:hypothetical protein
MAAPRYPNGLWRPHVPDGPEGFAEQPWGGSEKGGPACIDFITKRQYE